MITIRHLSSSRRHVPRIKSHRSPSSQSRRTTTSIIHSCRPRSPLYHREDRIRQKCNPSHSNPPEGPIRRRWHVRRKRQSRFSIRASLLVTAATATHTRSTSWSPRARKRHLGNGLGRRQYLLLKFDSSFNAAAAWSLTSTLLQAGILFMTLHPH